MFDSPSSRPRVLVVGGAGFIGSHVNAQLHKAGYHTVVLDNLTRGHRKAVTRGKFIEGDLGDKETLEGIMEAGQFVAVLHFAAYTDVWASIISPADYYRNNVANTLLLLEAMVKYQVQYLVFSSSAAVFGIPEVDMIGEEHPCRPISPYGKSKWMVEQLLEDFGNAYGLRFCSLRYFNAAGGDPEGEVKNYQRTEHNIIPRLLWGIRTGKMSATLFGDDHPTPDGSCIRDYIHIFDLARAHVIATERLLSGGPSAHYNLGNGQGFSVKEVIRSVEHVTGCPLQLSITPSRTCDPPRLVADSAKAQRELLWQPLYPDLNTIIEHAWASLV